MSGKWDDQPKRILQRSEPEPWAVKFCLCHPKVWTKHHGSGGSEGAAMHTKHRLLPKKTFRGHGALMGATRGAVSGQEAAPGTRESDGMCCERTRNSRIIHI